MWLPYLLPFLHLAYFCSPVSCRRGGNNGDDNGGSGGSGDGGSSGDDALPYQDRKPNYEPRCPFGNTYKCPCLFTQQRLKLYGLPGLYYNGTLTVTHNISRNSAYTVENILEDPRHDIYTNYTDNKKCPNDEREKKTYEYPALFYVGPRGNDEDPNPMHWSLKGFEPTDGPYLDILQRLVHIRSSDFNLDRPKDRRFTYWEETNADDPGWTTETVNGTAYWSTSLSQAGDGSYSARSTYDHRVLTSSRTSTFTYPKSQYITLTEVCRLGHMSVNEPFERRPDPDADEEGEEEEGEGESDDRDNTVYDTNMRPTVWLEPGAVANIGGIGSEKLSFSLETEWTEPTEAFTGFRRAGLCAPNQRDIARGYQHFLYKTPVNGILEEDSDGDWDRMWPWLEWNWNLTLSAKLEFKGSVVRSDSTEINGVSNGIMQFAKDYDWQEKEKELGYPGTRTEEEDDDSGASTVAATMLLSTFIAFLAASVPSLVS